MEISTQTAKPAGVRRATEWLPRTRARLADRGRWPRKWWWPLTEEINFSDQDWKKQHDEISKAINKLLLILIGFCFFCALSLGASDNSLLASDATITLPFANAKISFVSFLIIAPLVLAAFSFYLHIFAGYWIALSRQRPSPAGAEIPHTELPFVFNLQSRTANWLSKFLFYWLVPVVLGVFAWKALPRPEGPVLVSLTSAFIAVFLFLQLRRRSDRTHTRMLWLALLCSIFITGAMFLAFLEGEPLLSRQLHLRDAVLNRQDLRGLNLVGADLEGAELFEARLEDANLAGAHLSDAELKQAYLMSARLEGAELMSADLEGAHLEYADLSHTRLYSAYLARADLAYANLSDAHLNSAHLEGADLRYANYLTQEQVNSAHGDETTQLPPGIIEPESWKKKPTPTPPTHSN